VCREAVKVVPGKGGQIEFGYLVEIIGQVSGNIFEGIAANKYILGVTKLSRLRNKFMDLRVSYGS